jgi:hypothetical protein
MSKVKAIKATALAALAALALAALSGCGTLIPKRVEFGQREVQPVPEETAKELERRRQAAEFTARKLDQVVEAAKKDHAGFEVVLPAEQARSTARALTISLGPPLRPAKDSNAEEVVRDVAKLGVRLEKFKEEQARWVGHKIENSGRVKVGYFTWVGGILLLVAVGFVGLRIALKVAANANPVVAGAAGVVKVAGALAGRGLQQIVKAGESWKNKIKQSKSALSPEEVIGMWRTEMEKSQDAEVRSVIEKVTN